MGNPGQRVGRAVSEHGDVQRIFDHVQTGGHHRGERGHGQDAAQTSGRGSKRFHNDHAGIEQRRAAQRDEQVNQAPD